MQKNRTLFVLSLLFVLLFFCSAVQGVYKCWKIEQKFRTQFPGFKSSSDKMTLDTIATLSSKGHLIPQPNAPDSAFEANDEKKIMDIELIASYGEISQTTSFAVYFRPVCEPIAFLTSNEHAPGTIVSVEPGWILDDVNNMPPNTVWLASNALYYFSWINMLDPTFIAFRYGNGPPYQHGWLLVKAHTNARMEFLAYGMEDDRYTPLRIPSLEEVQSRCFDPGMDGDVVHKYHHKPSPTPTHTFFGRRKEQQQQPQPQQQNSKIQHVLAMNSDEAVQTLPVFMHLPKTGGSTMISILTKNVDVDNRKEAVLFYPMPPPAYQISEDLADKQRQIKFIGGHVAMRDLQLAAETAGVKFQPFTILRNPEERILSFHAYLKEQMALGDNFTVTEMLKGMLPNSMYRMLAPADSDLENTRDTMEAIKESMKEDFSLVGVTEYFDEALLLLKQMRIVDNIEYTKHKVLSDESEDANDAKDARMQFDQLEPSVQDLIRKNNALDTELYNFAKLRFEETLRQVKQLDPSFSGELKRFQESQQKRNEKCEDDATPGGFVCDSKKRKEKAMKRKEAINIKRKETSPEQRVMQSVMQAFLPRYW